MSQIEIKESSLKHDSQSQSNAHRPPQGYKPPHPNTATIASSGPITDPSTLTEQFQKFLSLQPQEMSASPFLGYFSHRSSCIHILNGSWILVLHIICL
jgi:hypothetical protein